MIVAQELGRRVGSIRDHLARRLAGRLAGWLAGRFVGCLASLLYALWVVLGRRPVRCGLTKDLLMRKIGVQLRAERRA